LEYGRWYVPLSSWSNVNAGLGRVGSSVTSERSGSSVAAVSVGGSSVARALVPSGGSEVGKRISGVSPMEIVAVGASPPPMTQAKTINRTKIIRKIDRDDFMGFLSIPDACWLSGSTHKLCCLFL
jgi:hypothetical protein